MDQSHIITAIKTQICIISEISSCAKIRGKQRKSYYSIMKDKAIYTYRGSTKEESNQVFKDLEGKGEGGGGEEWGREGGGEERVIAIKLLHIFIGSIKVTSPNYFSGNLVSVHQAKNKEETNAREITARK